MDLDPNSRTVHVAQTLAAIGAAVATRSALTAVYERITHREAPVDPSDASVDWPEAITWTIAASVGAGMARLVGRRAAAKVLADV